MRTLRTLVVLFAALGCGGGGGGSNDNDKHPVVVESSFLAAGDFDSCDVVGQVLNTDGDVTCDVFISFNARNRADTIIADGIDSIDNLPPNTRANYSATLLDSRGEFISCGEIASFELSELSQFCD